MLCVGPGWRAASLDRRRAAAPRLEHHGNDVCVAGEPSGCLNGHRGAVAVLARRLGVPAARDRREVDQHADVDRGSGCRSFARDETHECRCGNLIEALPVVLRSLADRCDLAAERALELLVVVGVQFGPNPAHPGVVVDAVAERDLRPLLFGTLECCIGRDGVGDLAEMSCELPRPRRSCVASEFVAESEQLLPLLVVELAGC